MRALSIVHNSPKIQACESVCGLCYQMEKECWNILSICRTIYQNWQIHLKFINMLTHCFFFTFVAWHGITFTLFQWTLGFTGNYLFKGNGNQGFIKWILQRYSQISFILYFFQGLPYPCKTNFLPVLHMLNVFWET